MEQKSSLKKIADMLRDPGFDRVLVACHRSPDGDAIGSSHALAYALRKMGKPVPFSKVISLRLALPDTSSTLSTDLWLKARI